MYLDGKYYNDINDLIDHEINYHKKYFTGKMNSRDIIEVMQILKYGIPCIINEDMNCGNFIITGAGEYRIIECIAKKYIFKILQERQRFRNGKKNQYNP